MADTSGSGSGSTLGHTLAMEVPLFMAKPTSAAFRAGASFVPSPVQGREVNRITERSAGASFVPLNAQGRDQLVQTVASGRPRSMQGCVCLLAPPYFAHIGESPVEHACLAGIPVMATTSCCRWYGARCCCCCHPPSPLPLPPFCCCCCCCLSRWSAVTRRCLSEGRQRPSTLRRGHSRLQKEE